MKLNNRRFSHWPEILGFLLPAFFAFFVLPSVLNRAYIFDVAFPKALVAFICILGAFGACLFSIGCLRYKRKDKGVLPDYAGFGFGLFIGSFAGLYLLVSLAPTHSM